MSAILLFFQEPTRFGVYGTIMPSPFRAAGKRASKDLARVCKVSCHRDSKIRYVCMHTACSFIYICRHVDM